MCAIELLDRGQDLGHGECLCRRRGRRSCCLSGLGSAWRKKDRREPLLFKKSQAFAEGAQGNHSGTYAQAVVVSHRRSREQSSFVILSDADSDHAQMRTPHGLHAPSTRPHTDSTHPIRSDMPRFRNPAADLARLGAPGCRRTGMSRFLTRAAHGTLSPRSRMDGWPG